MLHPIRASFLAAALASPGYAHGEPAANPNGEGLWLDTLFASGTRVTYAPGHGMTLSMTGTTDLQLNVSGQVQPQLRYTWGEDVADTTDFALKSARLRFAGDVQDGAFAYFLQLDAEEGQEGNGNLVDGWVAWQMNDRLRARLGQQKMRSSLQADASLSDTDLELGQNALATRAFAGRRSTGLLLEGKVGNVVQWHAGVMNNSTAAFEFTGTQANDSNELDFTFGALTSSDQCTTEGWSEGDLAHTGEASYIAGVNVLVGNDAFPGAATDNDMLTGNAFLAGKSGRGVAAQAELFARSDDDGTATYDSMGFYLQASYTMPPGEGTQWGYVVRASSVDIEQFTMNVGDAAIAPGKASELSVGLNAYYHQHRLKTQMMLTFLNQRPDGGTEVDSTSLDLLFTLMF
jgi:hypothetical protein